MIADKAVCSSSPVTNLALEGSPIRPNAYQSKIIGPKSCVSSRRSHLSAMAPSSQTTSSSQTSASQTWTFDDRRANHTSRQQRLARIDTLATLLDSAFVIPGTNVRFGLDAIVGLVPGIGDFLTSLVSLYIVHEARQLGAPTHLLIRMIANVAIDGIVGSAPLAGDVFDVMWRANRRNMTLLYDHLRSRGEFARPVSGTEA
jgi:uncharacterized protein DUF4112